LRGAAGDGDIGSGSGESEGDFTADAACAASDECRFAVEGLGWHRWARQLFKSGDQMKVWQLAKA
jgi:hypothetical protein